MNRFIVAILAVVAIAVSGGAAIKTATAQQVKSHPEITVDRTACDELTLTVVAYISHPEEETGTYELVTGWLGDDLDPETHVILQGQSTFTYTEVIDLPFDGDTFRAVLEIDGISEDPFDEEDVEATDETCSSISVRKDVDPEDETGQDFNFTLNGVAFELEDDDPPFVLDGLEAGTYTLDEIVPEGYVLTGIDCDVPTTDDDLEDSDVNIVLAADTDAECEVTNEPVPVATATPAPTSTPVATATSVPFTFTQCEGSSLVTRTNNGAVVGSTVNSPLCTVAAPAPTATPRPVTSTIRPPSTGDAGLVE